MSAGSVRALCCALGLALLPAAPAGAQVVLDGTAGPAGALPGPDVAIGAELGTRAGANLFHSFSRFDVPTGGSATFSGPDAIRHVIGRVTGGSRSTIDGALRSTIDGADLWLINPAGMLFGPNASLDLGGSLHIAAADELRLADGARFSAVDPAASTFTAAPPEAFGFLGAGRAPIDVRGAVLNVPTGAVLSVSGGDISLSGGAQLAAVSFGPEDAGEVRVESSGVVTISGQLSGLFANSLAASPDGGDAGRVVVVAERVVMRELALAQAVTLGGGAAGSVEVAADAVLLESGAELAAWTAGEGRGGDILVQAGELEVRGGSAIAAATFAGGDAGSLTLEADRVVLSGDGSPTFTGLALVAGRASTGDAGEAVLRVGELEVLDQAWIDARSLGQGNAGRIEITAETIALDGNSRISADSFGGRGGTVEVETGRLSLAGGGQISNSGRGFTTEPGGDLVVRAGEEIVIVGLDPASGFRSGLFNDALSDADAGDIVITTPRLTIDGGRITTDTEGEAAAGSIRIDGPQRVDIVLRNQGQIFSGTEASGAGGDVVITRGGRIEITGTGDAGSATPDVAAQPTGIFTNVKLGGAGDGGRIAIEADELTMRRGGAISAQTLGTGAAGAIGIALAGTLLVDDSAIDTAVVRLPGVDLPADAGTTGGAVTLAAGRVVLRDGGTIRARSERGPGAAGEITLRAPQSLELRGGTITSTAAESGGGRIVITVGELIDLERSAIATSVFGGEDTTAGDIVIDPRFIVLDRSDIVAQAQAGQGGNIDITVLHLFRTPTSRIDASADTGIDGTVEISSPDADIAGDLVVLVGAFVDAASLLRARCAARRDVGASSLTGIGRGGLPPSPDGPLASALAPPSVAEIPNATALLVLSCAGPA